MRSTDSQQVVPTSLISSVRYKLLERFTFDFHYPYHLGIINQSNAIIYPINQSDACLAMQRKPVVAIVDVKSEPLQLLTSD